MRPPSQPVKKMGMVVLTCYPNFAGSLIRRITVLAGGTLFEKTPETESLGK
jgi:hypothetical protein